MEGGSVCGRWIKWTEKVRNKKICGKERNSSQQRKRVYVNGSVTCYEIKSDDSITRYMYALSELTKEEKERIEAINSWRRNLDAHKENWIQLDSTGKHRLGQSTLEALLVSASQGISSL
jgi:hypothetical protein